MVFHLLEIRITHKKEKYMDILLYMWKPVFYSSLRFLDIKLPFQVISYYKS